MLYLPTEEQDQRRERNFTYHAPNENQVMRMKALRLKAKALSANLDNLCPPSRELSLAQTYLEQVVFFANASIVRNEAS